ncbi:MAG: glycosyltransferase [Actinomycetota bacterium]
MEKLIINFIGNYQTGYVGEISDEVMLTREIEELGHKVRRIPRDIWKAVCDGEWDDNWQDKVPFRDVDVNIICKWNHFNDGKYISKLKEWTSLKEAPVFFWVWDCMEGFPHGHDQMVKSADLYISNDIFHPQYKDFTNCYYFPMDVSSEEFDRINLEIAPTVEVKYDVAFFGSCIGQGDRLVWIPEINKKHKVVCFGWNHEGWQKLGLEAYPPVYGYDFVQKVAETKICLGFSVNPDTWGYWSNRTGKVLTLGGFLLYQYAPGMELFLRDGAEYFSSIDEANQKIEYYLSHDEEREKIAQRGYKIGRDRFTSKARIKELMILIDRYLKGGLWKT